jgi:argininosuccinate synthase
MTADPADAPDTPEEVTLAFEQGRPVALNGKPMKFGRYDRGASIRSVASMAMAVLT